ncbi:hypothetical protein SS1G_06852 [Sclerotinia sclerotiorum 1980 UF-70]|uniref:Uncharacterized protein n=1 Tax=Sclerotinia sclerotiorum (strain ATCC 18683 / 1980 / Ss-1) TaxID=665079 RepID=A7ENF3_SCLS1|nr:hypothetical protein SS1G_06852 [Sclerotinia sclerotiorum 1980 UF-70]EDO04369.1 hypothetical protein SS1G_06852 [Sclerotinia sclerotiorum 1980 UF-70]
MLSVKDKARHQTLFDSFLMVVVFKLQIVRISWICKMAILLRFIKNKSVANKPSFLLHSIHTTKRYLNNPICAQWRRAKCTRVWDSLGDDGELRVGRSVYHCVSS